MISKFPLLFIGLAVAATPNAIKLDVPPSPAEGRQVVDPSYHAFSIEFSSFVHYTGNSTYSNELNKNLPNNLREIGGVPLRARVGGGSQNVVTWVEEQEEGLIGYFHPGIDKAYNSTVGPSFTESFDFWPGDTEWTLGLPFDMMERNFSFLPTCQRLAKASADHLGDRLVSLEVGNEWGGGSIHPERTYSPAEYVEHWSAYARSVAEYALRDPDAQIWQVGSFHSPEYNCQRNLSCWTTDTILQLGINKDNIAKTVNTHQYAGDAWDGDWVNAQFLMNHNNTQGVIDLHRELSTNASVYGLPYELGETGSLSGHGKVNVSDTYAATLWMIDYVLYATQTNISRVYMHQGSGWKYSAWNPITAFDYPSGVLGSYYSYLFTYTALSGGNKQVELLLGNKTLVAYAIYEQESACKSKSGKTCLSAIVAVSLQAWEATSDPKERPSVVLELPTPLARKRPEVQRLTGPGTDVKWGITFAGQGVDEEGRINGTRTTERIGKRGNISLAAAEAVLITF